MKKMAKILPYATILAAGVAVIAYIGLLNTLARADEDASFNQAKTCIEAASYDINASEVDEDRYVPQLKNIAKACDDQEYMYAEVFDQDMRVVSHERHIESDLVATNFSSMDNEAFRTYALNYNAGELWIDYNSDYRIQLTFEWIPDPIGTDIDHRRFLLVAGKISTFRKDYQPTLMLFCAGIIGIMTLLTIMQFLVVNTCNRRGEGGTSGKME